MKDSSPADITDLISPIRNFINSQKDPNIIDGTIVSKSNRENIIEIELSFKAYLNPGSSVLINNSQGFVLETENKKIIIEIDSSDSFFVNEEVEVDVNPFSVILARLEKTILKIENNNLTDRNKVILNFLVGRGNPNYINSTNHFFSESLNESQRSAVNHSINSNDFHLIIGPPGTGKTHVIKELILEMSKKNQKILVTAWTNIAVDNILGRINEIPESKILRIGSKKEINPEKLKYTLFERRKQHPEWKEVNEIKNEISHHQKELNKLFESLSFIQNKTDKLFERKKQYNLVIKNIKGTIKEFNILMEKISVDVLKKDPELEEIEEKMLKNDLKAENYMNMVDMAYQLQEIEKSLPKNEDYYLLESELKKLKGKGLVKKVTSIFDKSGFEDYKSDLNQKKYDYNEMVIAFNGYWDFKDQFDEKYKLVYPLSQENLMKML